MKNMSSMSTNQFHEKHVEYVNVPKFDAESEYEIELNDIIFNVIKNISSESSTKKIKNLLLSRSDWR